MKIKLKNLKKLVRESVISEVGVSPAIFKANVPVKNPLDSQNIAKGLGDLERHFNNTVMHALLLKHSDKYNSDSREFDDATYQKLKDVADDATEKMMSQVAQAVEAAWAGAVKDN